MRVERTCPCGSGIAVESDFDPVRLVGDASTTLAHWELRHRDHELGEEQAVPPMTHWFVTVNREDAPRVAVPDGGRALFADIAAAHRFEAQCEELVDPGDTLTVWGARKIGAD